MISQINQENQTSQIDSTITRKGPIVEQVYKKQILQRLKRRKCAFLETITTPWRKILERTVSMKKRWKYWKDSGTREIQ